MSNVTTPYLYLLCRNDLDSMSHGKMHAHAAHAANQFTYDMDKLFHGERNQWYDSLTKKQAAYSTWVESARGFGTTISLSVSLREMQTVVMIAKSMNFAASETTDPTYPYIIHKEYAALIDHPDDHPPVHMGDDMMMCLREEITCGYVFGMKDELRPVVGNFSMVK